MTAVEDRPAVLAEEIPPPPACPPWCEKDNNAKTRTSWSRTHYRLRTVDGPMPVHVLLGAVDVYYGGRWEMRTATRIELGPEGGTVSADTTSHFETMGMIAVAALISDDVADAVQDALQLASSPEVTPAPGEDQ